MHVGKMMARLNPKNVRFDVGSGGMPEFLTTDIAAALAFVDAGLGRELLCKVWWPDGATLTQRKLIDLFEQMQIEEWSRRESAMLDATLAVAIHGNRAQPMYQAAHSNRWPRLLAGDQDVPRVVDGYTKVRIALLDEVCSDGLCPTCGGRGVIYGEMEAAADCVPCQASGHLRLSERGRAEAVGFSWANYRRTWAPVYDWTFQRCMDEVHRATRQFRSALGEE
jgi:hypothetical protein